MYMYTLCVYICICKYVHQSSPFVGSKPTFFSSPVISPQANSAKQLLAPGPSFVGKIFQKPWVFTIKVIGVSGFNFPMIQFYDGSISSHNFVGYSFWITPMFHRNRGGQKGSAWPEAVDLRSSLQSILTEVRELRSATRFWTELVFLPWTWADCFFAKNSWDWTNRNGGDIIISYDNGP